MLYNSAVIFTLFGLFSLPGLVRGQYCQRGSIVLDTQSKCLLSAQADLENCCQVCPVLNATGYYQFCLSVYDLGFPSCANSLAARQTACSAIGGDINAGTFMCLLSGGSNKSQSTGFVSFAPTPAATIGSPLAGSPTTAPTSGTTPAGMYMTLYALMTLVYFSIRWP